MDLSDLDTFLAAYLECAAWASPYMDGHSSGEAGPNGETNMDQVDAEWSDEALAEARRESSEFIEGNADDLADLDASQCGHDFWLTRNGHGAGFWDRGYGAKGRRLSDACKPYGSAHVWWNRDDNRLEIEMG